MPLEFLSFSFPDGEGRLGEARRSHMGKDEDASVDTVSGKRGIFCLNVSVWGTKGRDNSR